MGICLAYIESCYKMAPKDEQRYQELVKLANKYSYEYHGLDNSSVSDAVYDGLLAELKALEGEYPDFIAKDSPTQRVGSEPAKNFQKYLHF